MPEINRLKAQALPQRYLKRIRYGNQTPRVDGESLKARNDWLFEAVFDYGEHDSEAPTAQETGEWTLRSDPFSNFRPGFDLRTYRLCRRVLMVHHFTGPSPASVDAVVRSTDFTHDAQAVATRLKSVYQTGYASRADRSLVTSRLPALSLGYSEVAIDPTVRTLDAESARNLPIGFDGSLYQWVDLDSVGAPGILTEQAGDWYYKRNQGGGRFAAAERLRSRPAPFALARGQALVDLAGEGRLDLVSYEQPLPGYFERSDEGGWDDFTPFPEVLSRDLRGSDLRLIDLTGNGLPDVLISEHTVFRWHESLGKAGLAPERRSFKAWDEESGPRCVFSDSIETIFLADMSGDGLTDLVRVRFDEVCYWPNLGYGRFGAKVTMAGVLVLDHPDLFNARRVILADLDGSGTSDIVYVGADGVSLFFNQAGNALSPPRRLPQLPLADGQASLSVIDLLATGTACLVWSSPRPADAPHSLRFIDLMSGQKPNLLVSMSNGVGAETRVAYAASTQFYLEAERTGRPWATKLPFPVQVITRVEAKDLLSNTALVSTYAYAHGYFDGVEREFRGFARVDQRDAETVGAEGARPAFDLPPVLTRTWFHTGVSPNGQRLEALFRDPANQEYFSGDVKAAFLPDLELPQGLDESDAREAARALRGSMLRQEVYAEDGTDKAALPYRVSDRTYALACLQPSGSNRHAAFLVSQRELLDYQYERNPDDPRISHELTLAIDAYGNVLKAATVSLARRVPVFDEQKSVRALLTETDVTNAVLADDDYRTPLPAEQRQYELTSPMLVGATVLGFEAVAGMAESASEIAYDSAPTPGLAEKRLVNHSRMLYRKNDLSSLLPLGRLESRGLSGERYRLALTPGLLDLFAAKASRAELVAALTGADGGYRALDGGATLWVASGRVYYSPTFGDGAQQELVAARAGFFMPQRFEDPFGNTTLVGYDSPYTLLPVLVQDAVGNRTTAEYDYRVLLPVRVADANGNRAEARYDARGLLVGTALRGKATGPAEGDSFDDFVPDLDDTTIAGFFAAADPTALATNHLGTATTRLVYDLGQVPVCIATIARETHVSDLPAGGSSAVQLQFTYSDGFSRIAQKKQRVAPGPLDPDDPAAPDLAVRWVASGSVIYNNKGKPVRQFEPFFSGTHAFSIETRGVSSTIFYDAAGRIVCALHPDQSLDKTLIGTWRLENWDANDTIRPDPKTDPDIGIFLKQLPDADYLPGWFSARAGGAKGQAEQDAAVKAAAHAGTPTVVHADTQGRPFLTIADNGIDGGGVRQTFATRLLLDIQGRQRVLTDALGRIAMRTDYDLVGKVIHQTNLDAGERWQLTEAAGNPFLSWNRRNYASRTLYDVLRRPVQVLVRGGDPTEANPMLITQEILAERTIWGDSAEAGLSNAEAQAANLCCRVFQRCDSAGTLTTDLFDFKGKMLRSLRQLTVDYKAAPDWSANPVLEPEVFANAGKFDALGRAIELTAPDGSIYRLGYDPGGRLASVDVRIGGATSAGQPSWTPFVADIQYDAKSQRTLIIYGNKAETRYEHDPQTFRLTRLTTNRPPPAGADIAAQIFVDSATVQNLQYTYDPVGNVTRVTDASLRTVLHNNQQVDPISDYTYDPLYRLIQAKGREHAVQAGFGDPPDGNCRDYPFAGAVQLADLQALRNFTELYTYDPVDNVLAFAHRAAGGNWTRSYVYDEDSQIEPGRKSNRLSQTALAAPAPVEPYTYDAHGNIVRMTHLPLMRWDHEDHLAASSRQVSSLGGQATTYYTYDSTGARVRKVTESPDRRRTGQRLYFGGYEVFRAFDGAGGVSSERTSLHVMDDRQRIALVETLTKGAASSAEASPATRYQLGNHLGSPSVELDGAAALISFEEFAPFGSTSFQAGHTAAEVSLKRYRYTGNERDEETGLSYHGARYYAPWLARWTACDPAGLVDGPNLYVYVRCNPIGLRDPTGTQGQNDYGGTLPPGGLPAPDTTSAEPLPKADPEPPGPAPPPAAPPPQAAETKVAAPKPKPPPRRPTSEQLQDSTPVALFFLKIPGSYIRPYQPAPQGAPTGLDAIRRLNGQPGAGVAAFSRDIAPGTSVENLTLQTVGVLNSATGVLAPLARTSSEVAPAIAVVEAASVAESRFNVVVQDGKPTVVLPNSADLPTIAPPPLVEPPLGELPAAVGRKTVAATPGGPGTISGWGGASQLPGFGDPPAVSVWRFSNELGLTQQPHYFDAAGAVGSYGASHAERQALFLNPAANFVEVSKAPCAGCVTWISELATLRNEPITVYAKDVGFWWFFPGGAVLH